MGLLGMFGSLLPWVNTPFSSAAFAPMAESWIVFALFMSTVLSALWNNWSMPVKGPVLACIILSALSSAVVGICRIVSFAHEAGEAGSPLCQDYSTPVASIGIGVHVIVLTGIILSASAWFLRKKSFVVFN